ncbi:transglycosylase domain-containing protein [uncultured Hymenobacter sp.]|uniref:transglycosylase domain-containing protein n=1 Tax=uncultured Hymenobacter sp. TaxID=170016 RepID=UPI0035C9E8C8
MSPIARRRLLYALAALLTLSLLALAVFLWQRQRLLAYALGEVKVRVERKYLVRLTLGPARFTDLNTVEIQGMSLVPTSSAALPDTLLTARRLQAGLSVRSLFAGRPVFSQLQIDAARLTATRTLTGDNFSFLIKKNKAAAPRRDTTQGRNYGLLLNQVLETGFDNVPGEADFRNFVVRYLSPRHRVLLQMPSLRINEGRISGQMQADVDGEVNQLGLAGSVEPSDYAVDLRLYGRGQSVQLPYLPQRFNAMVSFDTVRVQLAGKDFSDEELTLRGTVAARNFSFYQPKVSATDVVVRSGTLDFVTTLGAQSIALEKGSRVALNQLVFYPEISFRRPLPPPTSASASNRRRRPAPVRTWRDDLQVSLNITSAETPVNDFFSSLPEGIFDTVTGVRGTGSLKYQLRAALDMAQVDSLKFDSSLRPSGNFAITRFGAEDLTQLNRDFPYTAYNDRGDSIKTFAVGPTNPDFVPYNQISSYLKTAITTAEDPRFFTHRGFMEKAFVKSAIQNIKERRFARGGSTISMQLVKNVFLTRQKVISRKIEEALIVWLLENTRLVSKERMFEVYLNVIEWGPKIYGVKEAAKFYYNKKPADLNLDESLYLASIIPKPKFYRQSFDAYGNLRRNTRYFFRLIADLMEMRGQISGQQRAGLNYGVALNGRARQYIVTARDTTRTVQPADTSQFEPLNLLDLLNTGATTTPDAGVNSNAATEEDAPPPAPTSAPK